jgi:hypothetical protein
VRTFMTPSAMGPITAILLDFFKGRVLLWFSRRMIDSASSCRARAALLGVLIVALACLMGTALLS